MLVSWDHSSQMHGRMTERSAGKDVWKRRLSYYWFSFPLRFPSQSFVSDLMVEPLCSPIHGRSDVSATPIIDHARFDYFEVSVFDTWPYDVSAALVADL